jgi:uncharacterized membrane protein YphA (DoxX/SURF4 family)
MSMNIVLWIVQILLAVTFLWSGATKLLDPAQLPWPWISQNPGLVKVTAIFDLLAGIGLVLPALLRILPKLTVYAAYGTIALMIAAIVFHVSRGEASQIGFNVFVIVAAAFIAWGRHKKAPIAPKGT